MSTTNSLPYKEAVAEQAVIGCILIDEHTIDIAREIINPDDFYAIHNQEIFKAMCHLEDIGKPINSVSVFTELLNNHNFQNAGGIEYLTECANTLPSASSIETFVGIVRSESIKRKLNAFGENIKKLSQQPVDDIDVAIAKMSDDLLNISSKTGLTPWVSFEEALKEACYELLNETTRETIPSGFIDLDSKIIGFTSGKLTIIAARPGMGKTALGLNIMQNAAFVLNKPVAFFSLEMSRLELINRTLSCMASVNGNAVRTKELNDAEWNRVLGAAEKYKNAKIYIDETPAIDIATLTERSKRLYRQHGIRLIIIDYLQLMHSTSRFAQTREQEIADVSRGLKGLSKELNIPVIALAQLNRDVDTRADKIPVLADLRESGSIEQDADTVIFIYRNDYYQTNSTPTNEAEIIIAKQRSGPTGVVKLHWEGQYTRFSNLEINSQF